MSHDEKSKIDEIKALLDRFGILPIFYSLAPYSGNVYEGEAMNYKDGMWNVFYQSRGHITTFFSFEQRDMAIAYFLIRMFGAYDYGNVKMDKSVLLELLEMCESLKSIVYCDKDHPCTGFSFFERDDGWEVMFYCDSVKVYEKIFDDENDACRYIMTKAGEYIVKTFGIYDESRKESANKSIFEPWDSRE